MPTRADETRRLRELHESYAGRVHVAVNEHREDMVRDLVDGYLAEALSVMAAGHGTGCGRPGCPTCEARSVPAQPPSWGSRLRRRLRGLAD